MCQRVLINDISPADNIGISRRSADGVCIGSHTTGHPTAQCIDKPHPVGKINVGSVDKSEVCSSFGGSVVNYTGSGICEIQGDAIRSSSVGLGSEICSSGTKIVGESFNEVKVC